MPNKNPEQQNKNKDQHDKTRKGDHDMKTEREEQQAGHQKSGQQSQGKQTTAGKKN